MWRNFLLMGLIFGLVACDNSGQAEVKVDSLSLKLDTSLEKVKDSVKAKGERTLEVVKDKINEIGKKKDSLTDTIN